MGLKEDLAGRILILDGGMGTMIQRLGIRCSNGEELNLTSPECVKKIHKAYIEAGADMIETNSFGANAITQSGQGREKNAAAMAFEAARTARSAADEAGRKVYVLGSMGPTGRSLTMASDASRPGYRAAGFDGLSQAYREQAEALISGGVDGFIIETCFDALNTKAAIYALESIGNSLPVIISVTVSDRSGRTLTGQTVESFWNSVKHCPGLAAFGMNCAMGAGMMAPLLRDIASFCKLPLIFYPNAGIPDEFGRYNDSPESFAAIISKLAAEIPIRIAGGCCGTGPEHIAALAGALAGAKPCEIPDSKAASLTVCGLETYGIEGTAGDGSSFTSIGERTNVAGSRKFAGLIASKQYDKALAIATGQIEGGASVIDINFDDPMLDSSAEMQEYLRRISGEPEIAKAAIMIDSSHWDTVVTGLKNVQGKSIVNSISLKEGPEEFIRKALYIRDMGAAMVVMAFDEKGQATDFSRKTAICARAYKLLTDAGIAPSEIIFDCNILTIGTGIAGHARFGVDFIESVRWIKANLPGALTSGGLSNLSFAFRGNNPVREAMHSVFLYHCIRAGLDMAIVNPQMLRLYDEIEPELRKCVEDVIFDRDPEATSRLIAIAERSKAGKDTDKKSEERADSTGDPCGFLTGAVVKGRAENLETAVKASMDLLGNAASVIEGPLMKGMEQVGELFGEGKMFLPQVVKSARVMHDAVTLLEPYMGDSAGVTDKPAFVLATVEGDVHDIGKNITGIVLQCSGLDVVDLGVMVPGQKIIDKAEASGAVGIGLSGLISPSLSKMEDVCRKLAEAGSDIPVFVGGAAVTAVWTAVKLAPIYPNVHYGTDASATAVLVKRYLSSREEFIKSEIELHERLRMMHEQNSPAPGQECATNVGEAAEDGVFNDIPLQNIGADILLRHFDWRMFFTACGVKGENAELRKEAELILADGGMKATVQARFLSCHREDDEIVSQDGIRFPMLRQESGAKLSLADFYPNERTAPLGLFAVSVNSGECKDCKDKDPVRHAVEVTLAEAGSSWMLERFSAESDRKVIMPGIGYACCPDHSLKRDVLSLLDMDIRLSGSCAMIPEASICGFVISCEGACFPDIRKISHEAAERYSRLRNFDEEEKRLFLGQLL